ncbi:MAG: hypothetical protein EXR35_09995 [Limnohabitans sp.]|nr:hypothetical protein [Limnohabitans sp.]
MNIKRRKLVQAIATTCAFPFAVFDTWSQEGYPNKPIKIVVPYAPGETTDVVARILGQKLTELWGQSVLIENRPGGGTVIAASAVAKAWFEGHSHVSTGQSLGSPQDDVGQKLLDFFPCQSLILNRVW